MKRQVRIGVFETNSSSTHSLSIVNADTFEKWKNGELVYNEWKDEFSEQYILTEYDKELAEKQYENCKRDFYKDWKDLTEEEKKLYYNTYMESHNLSNSNGFTFTEWRSSDLDYYYKEFETKHGDKIVAFGRYGYDG